MAVQEGGKDKRQTYCSVVIAVHRHFEQLIQVVFQLFLMEEEHSENINKY